MSIMRPLKDILSRPRISLAAGTAAILGLAMTSPAIAGNVNITADLGQEVISTKGGKVYLRLSLKALRRESSDRRTPVNVALVLDRSGSMRGRRIEAAREAARQAISRLGRDDYVSLVAYNDGVDVLARAGRLDDHFGLKAKIDRINAGGSTALHAGVSEGGRQVREYYSGRRVNRVILMSDGLANVGPSSPAELAKLGQELGSKGISVTTIGLGLSYNEDLMSRLALASDGNHAFAKTPDDLVEIFDQEFGDTLSIAAQDIEIIIECHEGFRPKRILGREAQIDGNRIKIKLNQLTGGSERYLIVELETESGKPVGTTDVASIDVRYLDLETGGRESVQSQVRSRYSQDDDEAQASINKSVMSQVTAQIATETSERAVKLRDKGDVAGARQLLQENAVYLKKNAEKLGRGEGAAPAASISALGALAKESNDAAASLDEKNWARTRKSMRYQQHKSKRQQTY